MKDTLEYYYQVLDGSEIDEYVICYCRNKYYEIFPEIMEDIPKFDISKPKDYKQEFELVRIFDDLYVYFIIKLIDLESGKILKVYQHMFKYESTFIEFCKKHYRYV